MEGCEESGVGEGGEGNNGRQMAEVRLEVNLFVTYSMAQQPLKSFDYPLMRVSLIKF
jgi:hypothetical protein